MSGEGVSTRVRSIVSSLCDLSANGRESWRHSESFINYSRFARLRTTYKVATSVLTRSFLPNVPCHSSGSARGGGFDADDDSSPW